jgi:hypothetical protein
VHGQQHELDRDSGNDRNRGRKIILPPLTVVNVKQTACSIECTSHGLLVHRSFFAFDEAGKP